MVRYPSESWPCQTAVGRTSQESGGYFSGQRKAVKLGSRHSEGIAARFGTGIRLTEIIYSSHDSQNNNDSII